MLEEENMTASYLTTACLEDEVLNCLDKMDKFLAAIFICNRSISTFPSNYSQLSYQALKTWNKGVLFSICLFIFVFDVFPKFALIVGFPNGITKTVKPSLKTDSTNTDGKSKG